MFKFYSPLAPVKKVYTLEGVLMDAKERELEAYYLNQNVRDKNEIRDLENKLRYYFRNSARRMKRMVSEEDRKIIYAGAVKEAALAYQKIAEGMSESSLPLSDKLLIDFERITKDPIDSLETLKSLRDSALPKIAAINTELYRSSFRPRSDGSVQVCINGVCKDYPASDFMLAEMRYKDFVGSRQVDLLGNQLLVKLYNDEVLIEEFETHEDRYAARKEAYLSESALYYDQEKILNEKLIQLTKAIEDRNNLIKASLNDFYMAEGYKDDEEFLKTGAPDYPAKYFDPAISQAYKEQLAKEARATFYEEIRLAIERLNEREKRLAAEKDRSYIMPEAVKAWYDRNPNYELLFESVLNFKRESYKKQVLENIRLMVLDMSSEEAESFRTNVKEEGIFVNYAKCSDCYSSSREDVSAEVLQFKTSGELADIAEAARLQMVARRREENKRIFENPTFYIDINRVELDDPIYFSRRYLQRIYSEQYRKAKELGKISYSEAIMSKLKNNGEYSTLTTEKPEEIIYRYQEEKFKNAQGRIEEAVREHLAFLEDQKNSKLAEAKAQAEEAISLAKEAYEAAKAERETLILERQLAADQGRFDWLENKISIITDDALDSTMGFGLSSIVSSIKAVVEAAMNAAKSAVSGMANAALSASKASFNVVSGLTKNIASLTQSGIGAMTSAVKTQVVDRAIEANAAAANIANDLAVGLQDIIESATGIVEEYGLKTVEVTTSPLPAPIKRVVKPVAEVGLKTGLDILEVPTKTAFVLPTEAYKEVSEGKNIIDVVKEYPKELATATMAPATNVFALIPGMTPSQPPQVSSGDPELERAAREAFEAEEAAKRAEIERLEQEKFLAASELEKMEAEKALQAALKELEELMKKRALESGSALTQAEKEEIIKKYAYAHPLLKYELLKKEFMLKEKEKKGKMK